MDKLNDTVDINAMLIGGMDRRERMDVAHVRMKLDDLDSTMILQIVPVD